MTTIVRRITGGVDTHLDVHVAAALDERGALLGVESFATTAAGYRRLLASARGLRGARARRCRSIGTPDAATLTTLTKLALRTLARRSSLEEEVKEIDRLLKALVKETAPELCAVDGVGTDVASALVVAAGDNPERLKNEATFAKLCGVSPSMPRAASRCASSGSIARGSPGELGAVAHRLHPDGQ